MQNTISQCPHGMKVRWNVVNFLSWFCINQKYQFYLHISSCTCTGSKNIFKTEKSAGKI